MKFLLIVVIDPGPFKIKLNDLKKYLILRIENLKFLIQFLIETVKAI